MAILRKRLSTWVLLHVSGMTIPFFLKEHCDRYSLIFILAKHIDIEQNWANKVNKYIFRKVLYETDIGL